MSTLPRVESDVQMSGMSEAMNDSMTTERVDGTAVTMKGQDESQPMATSDATSVDEADSSDQEGGVEPSRGPLPTWDTTPGWGFDILARDQPATGSQTVDQELPREASEELEPLDQEVEDALERDQDAEVDEENSQSIRDAVGEDDDDQAIRDAVAEDVRAEVEAADHANVQDLIAQQERWLNHLANDNPEEFDRLVASGVVDPDFVPQHPNNGSADGDDDGQDSIDGEDAHDGQDAPAANRDGHTPALAAFPVPGAAGIAAANQPVPTQPAANDGNPNQAHAPNTDHFVWLADRADASDENTACPACQTSFDPAEEVVYLNCGHAWCADCLNANYRSSLRSRTSWPPRCCSVPVATESIAHLLDADLQVDILVKREEFGDPNPIYCQTPKCTGGYIGGVHRSGQWAACQTCHFSTCVECRAPAGDHPMPGMHPAMESIVQREDKVLAEQAGWKQCPGCRNLVERTEGCDHMMCECGASFCYQCGGQLRNGMPCGCKGTPEWVMQMRQEAADAEARDEDGDEEEEHEEEEHEEEEHEEEEHEEDDDDADDPLPWENNGENEAQQVDVQTGTVHNEDEQLRPMPGGWEGADLNRDAEVTEEQQAGATLQATGW